MNQLLPKIHRGIIRFARRRMLVVALIGLMPVVARLAVLPKMPIPEPSIHDEFSYLLEADTFAHGRLTNPPHPMWQHFETFHVLQQPTYMSKYLPAPALFLALGQVTTGYPWAGVLLMTGLMCAAICWMLQGWVPPFWAMLGGLLAVTRIGTFTYWQNGYMGGCLAAAAGAIILGAAPRLKRTGRWQFSAGLGAAAGVLLLTRPFEGTMLIVMVAAWTRRNLIPAMAVGACFILWLGYYNYRGTGDPFEMPYRVHDKMYSATSPFLFFETPRPVPEYRHVVMRELWVDWAIGVYRKERSDLKTAFEEKARVLWAFYAGEGMLPVLFPIGVYAAWRWRRQRVAILFLIVMLIVLGMVKQLQAHYAAPAAALVFLIYALAVSRLQRLAHGLPVGMLLMTASLVAFVAQTALPIEPPEQFRKDIVGQLGSGAHLVIVHYRPGHDIHHEWVQNLADIDGSPIVWAREMNPEADGKLIRCFQGRKIWLLDADARPPKLMRVSESGDHH